MLCGDDGYGCSRRGAHGGDDTIWPGPGAHERRPPEQRAAPHGPAVRQGQKTLLRLKGKYSECVSRQLSQNKLLPARILNHKQAAKSRLELDGSTLRPFDAVGGMRGRDEGSAGVRDANTQTINIRKRPVCPGSSKEGARHTKEMERPTLCRRMRGVTSGGRAHTFNQFLVLFNS
jgi:hypothetical protein